MEKYRFKSWCIPEYMQDSIEQYLENGQPLGDFLTAVFENNFVTAMGRADDENLANMQAYANFLYNHVPQCAWGSRENVKEWISFKNK